MAAKDAGNVCTFSNYRLRSGISPCRVTLLDQDAAFSIGRNGFIELFILGVAVAGAVKTSPGFLSNIIGMGVFDT